MATLTFTVANGQIQVSRGSGETERLEPDMFGTLVDDGFLDDFGEFRIAADYGDDADYDALVTAAEAAANHAEVLANGVPTSRLYLSAALDPADLARQHRSGHLLRVTVEPGGAIGVADLRIATRQALLPAEPLDGFVLPHYWRNPRHGDRGV